MIINLIWSGDWVRLRLLIFLPLLRFRCQSNQTSHSSYLHLSSYIYVTAHLSYLYQSYSCCPPCLCWRLLSYFSFSTHQSYLISSYSSCPPCLGWRLWLLSAFVTCTTFPPLSSLAAAVWSHFPLISLQQLQGFRWRSFSGVGVLGIGDGVLDNSDIDGVVGIGDADGGVLGDGDSDGGMYHT